MSDYDIKSSVTMTDRASAILKQLQQELANAGRKFDGLGKDVSKANSNLTSLGGIVGTLGLTFSAVKIAQTAYDLGNVGSVAITTEKAFRNVMAAAGQSASILNEYKAAADGTIGSTALMRAANLALAGTTGELSTEMARLLPTLIEGARAAAALNPAYGDAQFMLDSLVSGVKRASPRLIDNTGIVLKLGEANQSLADKLGKSVDALTSEEQSLAILYATAEATPRLVAQVGDAMDETATASTRLAVAWSGLRTELGKALSPGTVDLQSSAAQVLTSVTAAISNDAIAKQASAVKNNEAALANYIGWVGKTAEAERQRVAIVTELTATIAEQRAQLALLNAALSSGAQTKAEAEARRLVGTTIDASQAMTKQEQEARRLATAVEVAAGATVSLTNKQRGLYNALETTTTAYGRATTAANKLATAAGASALTAGKSTLLGATDVLSQTQYTAALSAYNAEVEELGRQYRVGIIPSLTEYEYKLAAAGEKQQNFVTGLRDAGREALKTGSSVDDLTTKLEGMISAQLQPSFSLGDLAPELATGEGNLDEHYRRLAAIALRGGEELTAHSEDWKDTIALIPADVQAQGVGAMQAWATETVQAYDKGLDFSLIDRDALKARILAQLKAGEMRDAVIAELAAELGGSVSTAKLQEAAGMAVGGAGGKEVSTGIKDSIDVTGTLTLTAAAINAGAKTFEKELKASGGAVGGVILGGITEAVAGGAADIVKRLADALAPSVAKILENNARRSGQ
jgi:hypothetical protein